MEVIQCPFCFGEIHGDSRRCAHCQERLDSAALRLGGRLATAGPYAKRSLWLGIIGIFIAGIALGPVAILYAGLAHRTFRKNPMGTNIAALVGLVLGAAETVLWGAVIYQVASGKPLLG